MRLILEKAEIVRILGKHFGADLDPDKVVIRTDPLEVEVSGIPLTDAEPAAPAPSQPRLKTVQEETPAPAEDEGVFNARALGTNASSEPPEEGTDGYEAGDSGSSNPLAIIAESRKIEEQLKRENPNLGKPSPGTGTARPPGNYQDEIS